MISTITLEDLLLINDLSARTHMGNTLLNSTTEDERKRFASIKSKLFDIVSFFAGQLNADYGPFDVEGSRGNPVAMGGVRLKRVWAGMFKGAENKQYAAQLSIVFNQAEPCLDIGFYFGRAAGRQMNPSERRTSEANLRALGLKLSDQILDKIILRQHYNLLFDLGFKAFSKQNELDPEKWLQLIRHETPHTEIRTRVYPNGLGVIDNSSIASTLSLVAPLIGVFQNKIDSVAVQRMVKPPSPEQRAKQAERLAMIGASGEEFVLKYERDRLRDLGIQAPEYPRHVAVEGMNFGYDILSLGDDGQEIFIEVKTTTRAKSDPSSHTFFISAGEFEYFESNRERFRLYRVYDVEGVGEIEEIDLGKAQKKPDGYVVSY